VPELLAACDVGGTFTDAVAVRGTDRVEAKAPTTPGRLEQGAARALLRALDRLGAEPGAVDRVLHGTTVATNALLEDDLAPVALVTNEGFRDVLEVGRQDRARLYDLDEAGPSPLVPRELRFTVPGRRAADGRQLEPVEEAAVRRLARDLPADAVAAVAVCLLHAHRDPAHEDAVAEALRKALDDVHVVTSSGTRPEVREVERFTTTVANAGLVPRVRDYLDRLDRRLAEAGIDAPVRVMDSAGGLLDPPEAARRPVQLALSGPAGGVAALARLAEALGVPDAAGVDMGGTSTDVSLVLDGEPTTRWTTEVAGRELLVPAADVHTVGHGGGSIARADAAGGLALGPESAGADPGPACYGEGGNRPTLTDANLVLDRVPEDATLGGHVDLDRPAARRALAEIADELGTDPDGAAAATVEVAVARTARGVRVPAARQAADPAALALVAFGGAGPQFACEVAEAVGADRALVPHGAGVTSAAGLLAAPPRVERARSLVNRLDEMAPDEVASAWNDLAQEARAALAGEATRVERLVEARYAGQSHTLAVRVAEATPEAVRRAFAAEHEDHHGYRLPDEPVEAVTLRARAIGEPALPPAAEEAASAEGRPPVDREVPAWHAGPGQRHPTPVHGAEALVPGHEVPGPAIVAAEDTTALVAPGWTARVRGVGLVLHREGAP